MPAPLDLTGRRFGRLTVIAAHGRVTFGREQTAWLCRCDCGAEMTVPQDRLPHSEYLVRNRPRAMVRACPECLRKPCAVCGEPVPAGSKSTCCSPACRKAQTRAIGRLSKRKWTAADPERARRTYADYKARAAQDPVLAARRAEQQKAAQARRQARRDADPALREAERQRLRAHYAAHAAEIQARRRARLDALAPEQLARWLERMRAYGRAYRRQWREELRANPERHRKYLDLMREYRRRYALAELLGVAQTLTDTLET